MEDGNPLAIATGIAGRLAALKKLTLPTKGDVDSRPAPKAVFGGRPRRRCARPCQLSFSCLAGHRAPVRITSYRSTNMFPAALSAAGERQQRAQVLTPEVFAVAPSPARVPGGVQLHAFRRHAGALPHRRSLSEIRRIWVLRKRRWPSSTIRAATSVPTVYARPTGAAQSAGADGRARARADKLVEHLRRDAATRSLRIFISGTERLLAHRQR